ncbi:uncharacterized protein LOC119685091 [Teleopsis dalmanni]|uniref:uncharacterized protein LOC119685091 n=1 Tax=Teleopsis dalmanni TaxID=139649 RepID=UPI0018CDFFFA|nr:uncharacterized protein LOC119685091 [Teleopsis dalmanni]
MVLYQIFAIFIFTILLQESSGKDTWSCEIHSVSIYKSSTEYLDTDIKTERISRGKYGFSGFVDFKQDTSDKWTIRSNFTRSIYGTNKFIPTPYQTPKMKFHSFIAGPYKRFAMSTLRNCTKNGIEFEGNFVPPVTKRRMIFHKCRVNVDNWPYFAAGYYKIFVEILEPQYTGWEVVLKMTSSTPLL